MKLVFDLEIYYIFFLLFLAYKFKNVIKLIFEVLFILVIEICNCKLI
jgi:hypothetical protein